MLALATIHSNWKQHLAMYRLTNKNAPSEPVLIHHCATYIFLSSLCTIYLNATCFFYQNDPFFKPGFDWYAYLVLKVTNLRKCFTLAQTKNECQIFVLSKPKEKMLRRVIWHFLLEICAKVKDFQKLSHL